MARKCAEVIEKQIEFQNFGVPLTGHCYVFPDTHPSNE